MMRAFDAAWSVLKADPRQRMFGPPSGGPGNISVSQTVHPAIAGMVQRATDPYGLPPSVSKPFNFDSSRPRPFDTVTHTNPQTGESRSSASDLERRSLSNINSYEAGTPHSKLMTALDNAFVPDFREGATLNRPPYVTSRPMTPEEIATGEPDATSPMAFRNDVRENREGREFRDSLRTARQYGL
jgi:hypothetical protein